MQETQETWVWSLSQEDPLKEEMETLSNIPAWKIAWREEPGGLQSTELQRVWCDRACKDEYFLLLRHEASGILVPQSGIKSAPPAFKVWRLNH